MARYMIEFAHTPEEYIEALSKADARAPEFLSDVFWSRLGDRRAGWAIVEAASESEARDMVPPPLRDKVTITEVRELTIELIEWLRQEAA